MSGVNLVVIMGRLGKDPELKTLTGGGQVTNISVATSESWVDKSGQKQEQTEWHRVQIWGKGAEVVAKYFKKGDMIHIQGKIKTRSYEDNGVKKYVTEIICREFQFTGSKKESSSEPQQPQYEPPATNYPSDDIPF